MKSCKILGKEKQRIGRQQICNIKDQPAPRSRGRPFPHLTYDCLFSRDSPRIKIIFMWSWSIVVPAIHCMYSPINKCCGLWSSFSCLQTQETPKKKQPRSEQLRKKWDFAREKSISIPLPLITSLVVIFSGNPKLSLNSVYLAVEEKKGDLLFKPLP